MKKKQLYYGLFRSKTGFILCLLAVFFTAKAPGEVLFNYAEYKCSATITLPSEETGKEKSLTGSTGLKLSFRDAELRGYATKSKTDTAYRYGAGAFLFRNSFPLTLKAGHNTYSKSVSRLKNPQPSVTANPLTKTFAFQTGVGASLPALTSSVQPLSFSVCAKSEQKSLPVQLRTEGFFNEDREGTVFFSLKYKLSRSIFVQSALSGGRFYLENNSSILKKNNAAFEPDFFHSVLAECCFHSPLLKLNLYSAVHESPYAANSFWFKIEGRTSFRSLMLTVSYFALPSAKDAPKAAPLIGGSSSICRTIEQVSVNPQILFLFDDKNASSLRLGFSFLENQKFTATNTPVLLTTAKLRAGASYESRVSGFRLDWTCANILLDGTAPTKSSTPEKYHMFTVSSSFIGAVVKSSLSAGYSYYPPLTESSAVKEIYSVSLKTALQNTNLSFHAGTDITMKNGTRSSGEFDAGLSYSLRRKYIRSAVSVCLAMPF